MVFMEAVMKIDLKKAYVGTCQACFNRQVVKAVHRAKHTLVLHGYVRPGCGYIKGRCWGCGAEPYELSCEVTKEWVADCRQSLAALKNLLENLVDDEFETLSFLVVDYDAPRLPNGERPHKLVEVKRGETVTLKRYGQRTFDDVRRAKIREKTRDIEEMAETIVFLDERVAAWRYAPEALRTHEAVVAEEKAAKVEAAAVKAFTKKWARAWKRVGDAIRSHKDGYAWQCRSPGCPEEMIMAFFTANPFPTDKERKAARDRAKK